MKRAHSLYIALLFSSLSWPVWAGINARLDQSQITPGESVQLILQHDGQTDTQPDLTPLQQNFELAGQSTGSSVQIINGKVNAKVELSLMLVPKHSGKLQIPSLTWDGQVSPALELTVLADSSSHTANLAGAVMPHVFITTQLDQKQPYVQAAVAMTVKLYIDAPLSQAYLEMQPNSDVVIQQLGQDQQNSETYQGKNYQVIQRRYMVFPQRSGQITLEGPILSAQLQVPGNNSPFGNDPFFGRVFGSNPFAGMLNATRPIHIQADPIVLAVRARPTSSTAYAWLPAQSVTLAATYKPDNGAMHAGEPITLNLHLSANGQTAAQLPDLGQSLQLPAGLRAYPDQAKLNNEVQGDHIIGTRDQDIALIAERAGHYEIPAIHLVWWDTGKHEQKEIVLAAHTLEVLPSTAANTAGMTSNSQNTLPKAPLLSSPPPTAHDTRAPTNFIWQGLSLLFALLWLAALAMWWRSRRNTAPRVTPDDQQPIIHSERALGVTASRAAFWQACAANEQKAARQSLLDWARATWPHDPPLGLNALAGRLHEVELQQLIKQLDRACYTDAKWQGSALRDALKELRDAERQVAATDVKLPSLYSETEQ